MTIYAAVCAVAIFALTYLAMGMTVIRPEWK